MLHKQVFIFLKNVLTFLVNRFYKECDYIFGTGQSCKKASDRSDLFANRFVDKIVDSVRTFDPYTVDGSAVISYGMVNITMCKADVIGLSTIHRIKSCALTGVDSRMFVSVNLGAGPLTYEREIVFKFGSFERKLVIIASLADIKIKIDFSFEKATGRNGFLLSVFIKELKGFKFRVSCLSQVDWIVNILLNIWTSVFRRMLRNMLEFKLEQYILERLPKYQFPVLFGEEKKFNSLHEGAQSEKTSMFTSNIKEKCRNGCDRKVPMVTSRVNLKKRSGPIDLETGKDLGRKTIRNFQQAEGWTTDISITESPKCILAPCSATSNQNSSSEVSHDKAIANRDPIFLLSRETCKLVKSMDRLKRALDSLSRRSDSPCKGKTANISLKCKENYLFSDCSIPDESDDAVKLESSNYESTASSKGVEDELSYLIGESLENLKTSVITKAEFFHMLRHKCRERIPRTSFEFFEEIPWESTLLDESFSEIPKWSRQKCVKEDASDVERDMRESVVTYNSSSPINAIETSEIHVNELANEIKSFITKILISDKMLNFDSETNESEIAGGYRKSIEKVSGSTVERCHETQSIPVENDMHCEFSEGNSSTPNLDSKMNCTDIFQNFFPDPSTTVELAKELDAFRCRCVSKDEFQIESIKESIKSCQSEKVFANIKNIVPPETLRICDNDVDDQNGLKSNIFSNLVKTLKTESITLSKDAELDEKQDYKVNEKSFCNDVEVCTRRDELDKDLLQNNEELSTYNMQHVSFSNKLREKLECLFHNTKAECSEFPLEFLSITALKTNPTSNHNSLTEAANLKKLNDFIHEEIISRIHKLKSEAILGFGQQEKEYSDNCLEYKTNRKNFTLK